MMIFRFFLQSDESSNIITDEPIKCPSTTIFVSFLLTFYQFAVNHNTNNVEKVTFQGIFDLLLGFFVRPKRQIETFRKLFFSCREFHSSDEIKLICDSLDLRNFFVNGFNSSSKIHNMAKGILKCGFFLRS